MVAIIDYDAGNIKSVEKALQALGENAVITRDKACILEADKVILPGVGAFGDAMQKLEDYGLTDVIREVAEKGTPFWESVWDFSFCLREVKKARAWTDLVSCRGKYFAYRKHQA